MFLREYNLILLFTEFFDINFMRDGKILGQRKEFSPDFQECLLYDQFSRRW